MILEGRNGYSKKESNLSNSYIAGFGHPLYSNADDDPPKEPEDDDEPVTAPVASSCEVILPLLRNGDTGATVKNAQALLISKGYPCGGRYVAGRENPDGEFGPTTEKSVKSFQSLKKLRADGIIDAGTWKALLTA